MDWKSTWELEFQSNVFNDAQLMFRGLKQSINQSKIILLIGTLYFIAKTELSVLSRFKTSFFITLEFLHQVWDQLVHLVVSYLNRQLSLTLIWLNSHL